MQFRGGRGLCAVVTLALPLPLLGATQARDARADDRPCVESDDDEAPPPPPKHRRRHPRRSVAASYYEPYVAVQPPPERVRVPVELTPSAGYTFSTGVPVDGGVLVFAPSPAFGATLDVGDWYGARLEASYLLQFAGLQLEPGDGSESVSQYTVTAHHFQLGVEFDILRHARVRPFIGVLAGAVWFSPQSDVPDELWFEASIEAGAKIRITKALGIRAQATVTGITMDSRSQVFCPNGCYTEWYGIGLSQLALTAGPTLRF